MADRKICSPTSKAVRSSITFSICKSMLRSVGLAPYIRLLVATTGGSTASAGVGTVAGSALVVFQPMRASVPSGERPTKLRSTRS